MKVFHNINLTVFVKEEENYEKIKKCYLDLFPFDLKKARVLLCQQTASSFQDRKIRIIEVRLENNKWINEFMKSVMLKLSESDIRMMIDQINTRVDENGDFFFRLSKSELLDDEPKYVIVDHGDCYHFRCHIAAYPQNKENSIKLVKGYLIQFINKVP